MKVKVMRFQIAYYDKGNRVTIAPEEVEREVNQFCETVDVVDITCSPVTTLQHNNGGWDVVELWYNISYNEPHHLSQPSRASDPK